MFLKRSDILIAESGSGFGGSAKYLYDLLSTLEREDLDVEVLAYGNGPFLERIKEQGYCVGYAPLLRFAWFENKRDPFGRKTGNLFAYLQSFLMTLVQVGIFVPALTPWLFLKRVRIVHLNNEIRSHVPLLVAARLAGCRVLCHLHGWRSLTRLEKVAARFVHLYVGITHRGTFFYKKEHPSGRFVTVVNGLRFERGEETKDQSSVRQGFGFGKETICLGIIGRIIPWKGQETFLDAFEKASKVEPHVRALIVGSDPDSNGSYLKLLHEKVRQLGIQDKVHFVGWQKEIQPYLAAMDIVVHASLSPEAFGLVIAEAMAEGKPVVASDAGGVPELIQDHVTGLLVPPKDPERLSKALLELIQNPGLSARIGEAGRNYVLKHFDMRENSRKIVRIYRTLLGDAQFLRPGILTTYPIPQSPLWQKKTHLVAPRSEEKKGLLGWWGFRDWTLAFRLLRVRGKFDVLITGAEREDCLFAILQGIVPGRKIPHVMIDCLWKYETNPFRYWMKRLSLQGVARSVNTFVVWSKEERTDYAHYFRLPFEKFLFLPHHTTLEGYPIDSQMGNYLFAGGDSSRDYQTLIEALKPLGVPTVIVARQTASFNGNGKHLPPHIQVRTTDPDEFRKVMAGSKLVVIPMERGLLQSAGQQSYLNAMLLQKPVIVTETKGVVDYVTPGVTGIVIPPGDPKALQDAILRVLADGEEIQRMVQAAYERVQNEFSLDHFVGRILSLGEKVSQNGK